jgi:hypothetical protein
MKILPKTLLCVPEDDSAIAPIGSELILAGYRQMASDAEREAEAGLWSEALIGDGIGTY